MTTATGCLILRILQSAITKQYYVRITRYKEVPCWSSSVSKFLLAAKAVALKESNIAMVKTKAAYTYQGRINYNNVYDLGNTYADSSMPRNHRTSNRQQHQYPKGGILHNNIPMNTHHILVSGRS